MRALAVNENNDIYFGSNGHLAVATDLDAVIQGCEQSASILKGELPYAQSVGIPFFQTPFDSSPDLSLYEMYLRKQLLRVPNVIEIISLAFAIEDKEMKYEAIISSTFGEATIRGDI